MTLDQRMENLRARALRLRPARLTAERTEGGRLEAGPAQAVELYLQSPPGYFRHFTTDRADYAGLAGLLDALCRPAPDRRIEDYA